MLCSLLRFFLSNKPIGNQFLKVSLSVRNSIYPLLQGFDGFIRRLDFVLARLRGQFQDILFMYRAQEIQILASFFSKALNNACPKP